MDATLMSWEEIKYRYPDRWVAISNYKKDGPVILEGIPVEVCEESDMYDAEVALKQKGIAFVWRRTTELDGANVICRM